MMFHHRAKLPSHLAIVAMFSWVLLLLNALYHVASGGTKWNPQTEHAHRVYSTALNDPCDPTRWAPTDDAWRYTSAGDKSPPRPKSPDELCQAALKSLMSMHWTDRPDCTNPVGAQCRNRVCVVFVQKDCRCAGSYDAPVPFKRCAKQVLKNHGDFLKREVQQLKNAKTPQVSGQCGCPHCRTCPLKAYGCPYCPIQPQSVESLEMEGEDYYNPKLAAHLSSLQIPKQVPKATRTSQGSCRWSPGAFPSNKNFATQVAQAVAGQTQNQKPKSIKGKEVAETQPETRKGRFV